MIEHILRFVLPAAYALLPADMASAEASALLLSIGLQESDGFRVRRQYADGPARGFWQFEIGGVRGVLKHPQSAIEIAAVLKTLRYAGASDVALHDAIEHNDTLAACFARCLLWTLPKALPGLNEARIGWQQYTSAWRPGKPRPETWQANYSIAWGAVLQGRTVPPVAKV